MPIEIKIDVTKILKQHIYEGKKGKYLTVVLWETPDDKYGNDFRAVQGLSKEARDAREKGPILGNGKHFGSKPAQKPAPAKRPADPDLDAATDDDCPF